MADTNSSQTSQISSQNSFEISKSDQDNNANTNVTNVMTPTNTTTDEFRQMFKGLKQTMDSIPETPLAVQPTATLASSPLVAALAPVPLKPTTPKVVPTPTATTTTSTTTTTNRSIAVPISLTRPKGSKGSKGPNGPSESKEGLSNPHQADSSRHSTRGTRNSGRSDRENQKNRHRRHRDHRRSNYSSDNDESSNHDDESSDGSYRDDNNDDNDDDQDSGSENQDYKGSKSATKAESRNTLNAIASDAANSARTNDNGDDIASSIIRFCPDKAQEATDLLDLKRLMNEFEMENKVNGEIFDAEDRAIILNKYNARVEEIKTKLTNRIENMLQIRRKVLTKSSNVNVLKNHQDLCTHFARKHAALTLLLSKIKEA